MKTIKLLCTYESFLINLYVKRNSWGCIFEYLTLLSKFLILWKFPTLSKFEKCFLPQIPCRNSLNKPSPSNRPLNSYCYDYFSNISSNLPVTLHPYTIPSDLYLKHNESKLVVIKESNFMFPFDIHLDLDPTMMQQKTDKI